MKLLLKNIIKLLKWLRHLNCAEILTFLSLIILLSALSKRLRKSLRTPNFAMLIHSNLFQGQQQILLRHVEEEYANLLAGDAIPGRRRTRNSAETRSVTNRTRTDDEERHVAHRRHGPSGDLLILQTIQTRKTYFE
jgi:hypothetical protein